jgi:hypothetical protein
VIPEIIRRYPLVTIDVVVIHQILDRIHLSIQIIHKIKIIDCVHNNILRIISIHKCFKFLFKIVFFVLFFLIFTSFDNFYLINYYENIKILLFFLPFTLDLKQKFNRLYFKDFDFHLIVKKILILYQFVNSL